MAIVDGAPAKAGFWRRIAALLIDIIVVLLPLQILVVILFAMTNGAVQGSFGIAINICQPATELPDGLQPPPLPDANKATHCRSSLFGLPTANSLEVSKVVQNGNVTSSQSTIYSLDADGKPVDAFDTDWIAALVLFVYLVAMERRSGATVGKRALGIRTVDNALPSRIGIPLRKAIARQLAIYIGAIPLLLVLIWLLYLSANPPATMPRDAFLSAIAVAALIWFAWFAWIVIAVSRKRDPIYDRIAGTSVVRTG